MSILMGGSSSSGSSMLRYALNADSRIFSGAELNFFNKDIFFDDWNRYKYLLLGSPRRLSTSGWAQYPGHRLLHQDYKWSAYELRQLVGDSQSLKEFYVSFFSRALSENAATHWVEKTPSNTYCFERFLKLDAANKVVHVVRNPYDTIASLLRRGHSPFFAVGTWIYNNSAAMSVASSDRYHRIVYEDLVREPDSIFSSLFEFIGIPESSSVTVRPEKTDALGIGTWGASPKGPVTANRVGGFFELDTDLQEKVKYAFSAFRVRDSVLVKKGLISSSGKELCDALGYDFYSSSSSRKIKFDFDLGFDWLKRTLLGYRTGMNNYPAKFLI